MITVAALVYWAVNIATARLDEETFRRAQMPSPRTLISEKQATLDFGHLPKLNGEIKICRNP
jgi:hypothetical protein